MPPAQRPCHRTNQQTLDKIKGFETFATAAAHCRKYLRDFDQLQAAEEHQPARVSQTATGHDHAAGEAEVAAKFAKVLNGILGVNVCVGRVDPVLLLCPVICIGLEKKLSLMVSIVSIPDIFYKEKYLNKRQLYKSNYIIPQVNRKLPPLRAERIGGRKWIEFSVNTIIMTI